MPQPILRNGRREFVITAADGSIEKIPPGATVVGERYLQYRRPLGPLKYLNPPPPEVRTVWDPLRKIYSPE